MSIQLAEQALQSAMRELVHDKKMLTGMTVCYGKQSEHFTFSTGHEREVVFSPQGFEQAQEPITPSTIYDLASLTKLYTLVSVLMLVQSGEIRLSDSIARLDPRFVHLSDTTVEEVLSYLACLRTQERVDAQPDAFLAREVLFSVRRVPILAEERLYSDMNALVLQFMVEAVSGLPFDQFLTRYLLKPAGLMETWAVIPRERQGDLMDYNYEYHWQNGMFRLIKDAVPGRPHDPKARLLQTDQHPLSGHAGLFATADDVCRFVQALLSGVFISKETLLQIGVNRTGFLTHQGNYRQFLGLLCFCRSPLQFKSEVPEWMGLRSFGLAGYTGNHLAMDPETGVFDLLLGNRCHNRLSQISPAEDMKALGLSSEGAGQVVLPDGTKLFSSFQVIHQKDRLVHNPVYRCLLARKYLPDSAFLMDLQDF